MNKPCARITLDLQQPSTSVTVAVKRNDIGRMIRISLSDGGFPYEISPGCYAVLTGTKPDGNILYNHCHIEQNTIIYEVTEQTTAAAGRMKAEIKLYSSDDHLVTSATFRILVDGTIYDDNKVESKDEVSALTHLIFEAIGCIDVAREVTDAAEKATEDARTAIINADSAVEAAASATHTASDAAERANTAAETAGAAMEETMLAKDRFLEEAGNALDTIWELVDDGVGAPAIVEEHLGTVISIADSTDRQLKGLRVFGKTLQNGIPTSETPVPLESVGDGGSLDVTVAGKNLIDLSEFEFNDSNYLHKFDVDESATAKKLYDFLKKNVGKTMILSADITGESSAVAIGQIRFYKGDTLLCIITPKSPMTIELSDIEPNLCYIYGSSTGAVLKNYQIEYGSVVTEYEPYHEQSLTIQKPKDVPVFLPGIPVTSGGNYTDENGQQWISDEVDFVRGKYVQRSGIIDSYAGEVISGTYMSTTGKLSEGATVLYELSEPIAHDLTAEERAQYAVLHTNYPNTTICNDGGADMEVKYVADTKRYIDKKFTALSTALLNS